MNELDRLAALYKTRLLDSLPEERFDRLTRLASRALGTEIALVSLIDVDRQWFKSRHGLDAEQTPRDQAFCAHAIQSDDIMVVPDASQDPRFAANPLVTGDPNISFYAGAPLITKEGHALGTLCVIDNKPRSDFSDEDKQILADMAATIMSEIEANAKGQVIEDLSVVNDAQGQVIQDLNLVNEELQHRMGNMYAHVSSLISMMARSGGDQKDFVRRLRDRIMVLADTQALIASHNFKSAPLSAIFESTLAPFLTSESRPRVKLSSISDIEVSARGAFTMTLMLNELATNAVKHGALKDTQGLIDFSWAKRDDDMVSFNWIETCIGSYHVPSQRKGFGSQILARIVPMDFQGVAHHDIRPEGLHYSVSARLDRIGVA